MSYALEKYLPWLTLREIPGLGNIMVKRLIDRFGSPEMILAATESRLKAVHKITAKTIHNIQHHEPAQEIARKELAVIAEHGVKIITLTDTQYPVLLRQIPDPPPFLTYLGSLDNQSPCIAVIGSRTATSYGLSTAENLSYRLALKGFQVVSGLARGIDAMAHRGALRAKGKTIAVLGSGLNRIYPRENRHLFDAISETGTIFSEFRVNCAPLAVNFPIRNRIIAGLSCGSIVVEAAKRSGSLITARLAGEYNREVFAVPGSIKSPKSQGTHSLLKQGARLVETEMDIIDELTHFIHANHKAIQKKPLQKQKMPQYKPCEQTRQCEPAKPAEQTMACEPKKVGIIHFLEPYPVHIDVLIENSGMDGSQVTAQLLDLEFEGRVTRHQGNYYSISEEDH